MYVTTNLFLVLLFSKLTINAELQSESIDT